ncbi:MAG: sucrose synthase [Pirellulaceae bacterium]
MRTDLEQSLEEHRDTLYLLLRRYRDQEKPFLLRSDIVEILDEFCAAEPGSAMCGSPVHRLLHAAQEAFFRDSAMYLDVRWRVAQRGFWLLHCEELSFREISVTEFLRAKEQIVEPEFHHVPTLEFDLKPFERGFPRLREARSIGQGVEFLNRHLSNRLFQDLNNGGQRLFEFLRLHRVQGQQLMLNSTIANLEALGDALQQADEFLDRQPQDRLWTEIAPEMARLGFESGWGKTVERARETMGFLSDILEAPGPGSVARFLERVPMVFTIAVISPHGYFAQSGVLGKPDTGGQVVYILDQVRALEREMYDFIDQQGLNVEPRILVLTRLIPEAEGTTCQERLEPVVGTRNARILRVPFRNEKGEIVPKWISRFHIWPYLERFAEEASREIVAEVGQRPDFIIGNYSDGNLVASMLAHGMKVTQCNIAHALEKSKYLYSDLYWKEHDEEHHFACQYTADLISMNTADFIITSTYQEIAGTSDTVGQYESYQAYTMPALYRVVYGIDVFDPKFNIVSPGADPNVFFPFFDTDRRPGELRDSVAKLIHGDSGSDTRGHLIDARKPLLFAMSRLDYIKNLSGLLEWYAHSEALREEANLVIVGGHLDPSASNDDEEADQIRRIHGLLDEHQLDHQVRWLPMQSDKHLVGELYRHVADTRGVFVQPALFEAFGLTVLEAMSSGLPTFATCYGGPLETIVDGVSGFHIDPNHGEAAAKKMRDFLAHCREAPDDWDAISRGGLDRISSRYTWKLYANRLLKLARIYGFWKYISNIEREETGRYLEMFYFLMFRPLAASHGPEST